VTLRTVADERELDVDGYYVRCGTDPKLLSGPRDGNSYARTDGAPWPKAGYCKTGGNVRPCVALTDDPGEKEANAYWSQKDA
jgi:hypothetical protein